MLPTAAFSPRVSMLCGSNFSQKVPLDKKCVNISSEVRSLTEELKIRPEGGDESK